MKRQKLILWSATALVAACLFGSGLTPVHAQPTNQPAATKTDAKKTAPAPKKKLTGAELYAANCNRCHPERYPTEWTPAQWKTIMLHMRVRANLPDAQAKLILKYLQEDAGQ